MLSGWRWALEIVCQFLLMMGDDGYYCGIFCGLATTSAQFLNGMPNNPTKYDEYDICMAWHAVGNVPLMIFDCAAMHVTSINSTFQ